jgi:hypothetical protein
MRIRCPPRLSPLLAFLLLAGCMPAPASPEYDSRKAEETLVLALDAWKEGRAGSLADRDPPIRFEDDDLYNGLRLTGYRVQPRATPLRPFDDAKVALSLHDRNGNSVEKTAAYQISLAPDLAVLRNE